MWRKAGTPITISPRQLWSCPQWVYFGHLVYELLVFQAYANDIYFLKSGHN